MLLPQSVCFPRSRPSTSRPPACAGARGAAGQLARLGALLLSALGLLGACDRGAGASRDPDRLGSAPAPGGQAAAPEPARTTDRPSGVSAEPPGGPAGTSADRSASADAPTAGTSTPSSSGAAAAPVVQGEPKSTEAYAAWLQSTGRYVAGKPAAVQAVVEAKGGFKCNEKYPYKFKLDPPSVGVSYPESVVRGIQYGKTRSSLTIPFTASQPGTVTISGTFYLSVCDDASCKIGKQPLRVTVSVEPG